MEGGGGPVRVCVVGCGGVSGSHLSAYQSSKLATLVSCVDIREPVAQAASSRYGAPSWTGRRCRCRARTRAGRSSWCWRRTAPSRQARWSGCHWTADLNGLPDHSRTTCMEKGE